MNRILKNFGIVLITVFAASYIIFYPTTWLISDVNAYVNQALAFAEGHTSLNWKDVTGTIDLTVHGTKYPLGTATWLAIFIFIGGPKAAFLSGLISVILSSGLLHKIIKSQGLPNASLAILFLYAPLLFFSRTLMSSMPSLLLVSGFLFVLFEYREGWQKYLILGFLTGLSIWFRESNLMICGPLCIWVLWRTRAAFPFLTIGVIVGLSFRLISSWWVYGDPLFYVLAEPFSLEGLWNNSKVYFLLISVVIPFGWIFNGYRGKYSVELISTIWIFILFYFLYDFNATAYSGFSKGLILTGRFLIPSLPLFVIAMAGALDRFPKISRNRNLTFALLTFSVAGIILSQYLGKNEHKKHSSVIAQLNELKQDVLIYDTENYTNINRYLNAFNGLPEKAADIRMLTNRKYITSILDTNENVFVIESLNEGNEEKDKRTEEMHKLITDASLIYSITPYDSIRVSKGLMINIYSFKK